ncbi:hypothetical protein [Streptomyces sp. NPDC006355]|uniref:hypothetical protein n=1 Tax=Streptomyces sp. NPDC006355 TaxID=3156758 RepID=UPI0033AE24CE
MSGTSGSVAGAGVEREYEILCDDAGTFLRRYTVDPAGVVTPVDTALDGTTPYTVTGTVGRCREASPVAPQVESTLQRQTGAGSVTIPAGARSVTLVVYAGSPTVAIGSASAVPVAAGTSLTWGVDQGGAGGEQLLNAFTVTGGAGADFLLTTTREA